jgi:hypothetical protein
MAKEVTERAVDDEVLTKTLAAKTEDEHIIQIYAGPENVDQTSAELSGLSDWISMTFLELIGLLFALAGLIMLLLPMIGVFFIPRIVPTEAAHNALCGLFFFGDLLSLVCIFAAPCADQKKILAGVCICSFFAYKMLMVFGTYAVLPSYNNFFLFWYITTAFAQLVPPLLFLPAYLDLD